MSSDEWQDGGTAIATDNRGEVGRSHPQSWLFAYCAASGLAGTATAVGLSFAASGVARIAVWATTVALVSLLAGLAYDSGPVNALRSAGRLRRQHGDVRARSLPR